MLERTWGNVSGHNCSVFTRASVSVSNVAVLSYETSWKCLELTESYTIPLFLLNSNLLNIFAFRIIIVNAKD